MPIESKTKNLNWPSLQGTPLGGGAYILERFASADENTATFETRTSGERGSKALVRLAQADDEAGELQLLVWQALKKSGHPNLIPIWGTGRARINGTSLIYVVVEASDENLAKVLEERALEPEEAGEILVSLVGALGHLHSHGFVHGALSPEQVLAVGESVKVSTGGVRRTGSLERLEFYKPKYRAPESSEGNISPAADVWCLGATLVQALTQRVCSEDCLEEAARLAAPFDAIAKSCLQKEPVARGSLSHLLALYDGTAANASMASSAGAGTKTMAAAAGESRGAISFDWDGGEEPETKREPVKTTYLAPGPMVPEAEAFAAEATAGVAAEAPTEAHAAHAAEDAKDAKEPMENAVPAVDVRAAAHAPRAEEPAAEEAALPAVEAEARVEESAPLPMPSLAEELPDEVAFVAAAPVTPEAQVEHDTVQPTAAAQEPVEATAAPVDGAPDDVIPRVEEMPIERKAPVRSWLPAQPKEETYSPDVNEPDPVAAANARLLAWREAAAAATRSQSAVDTPSYVLSPGPEEIRRAKRRAWAFVAVALVILLAVVWELRPSRAAHHKAAQMPVQTAQKTGSSTNAPAQPEHERPVHGRTMTLPAAGPNGQPDTAIASTPKDSSAQETTPAREAAAAAAPKAEGTAQSAGPAGPGPVWRVILYTYSREADATKRAATIKRRHPDLSAEVFAPNGAGKSPFLVSIGGSTDRDAMAQLRHTAVRLGLPRDAYLQNYSR